MGNFLVSITSIFVPLFVKTKLMPLHYNPYNYNINEPWTPPNKINYELVYNFYILIILLGLGTISGTMATIRNCEKKNYLKSFLHSFFIVIGFIIGNIVLLIMPFLKAVLILCLMGFTPYTDYIAHGIITSLFVMVFGAIGNSKLISSVCHK
jgi:hypothetical protein